MQDGSVKLLAIKRNGTIKEKTVYESTHPILRLAQSLTGDTVIASVQDPNKSLILREAATGEWIATDQIHS